MTQPASKRLLTEQSAADHATNPATPLGGALSATYDRIITAVTGETAAATVARINAALSAGNGFGARTTVKLVGDFTINAPLVIPSNTTLDAHAATVTLASNSLCNSVQNAAVSGTRRVLDASVTASSTTITSTAANFTNADIGKAVAVHGAGASGAVLTTTITAVASASSATLAAAASTTGTSLYAAIGSRDSNIRLTGGKWVRSASNYVQPLNGWNSNNIRFRHVDNLEIDHLTLNTVSGKYSVNVGDCHNFKIDRIQADSTASDVVHVNGPADTGRITNVNSDGSGDDIVSLTGGDFYTVHQMADCQGDITDVTIENVTTAPSTHVPAYTRAVLLLAGRSIDTTKQYKVARINVRNIDSQLESYPVWVGNDVQDSNTQGGSYSDILIDGVMNRVAAGKTPPAAAVRFKDGPMSNLEVRSATNQGGTVDVAVETAAVVTGLRLAGVTRSRYTNTGTVSGLVIASDRAYGALSGPSIENKDRLMFRASDVVTLPSGTVILSYFRPTQTILAQSVTTVLRGTGTTTATLCRIGLYEANKPNKDDLTLIASTPNNPSIWPNAYAAPTFTLSTAVTLDPMKEYAIGILFVGTTGPQLSGITGNNGGELTRSDRLAGSFAGQTDLPATIGWASVGSSVGAYIYSRINNT